MIPITTYPAAVLRQKSEIIQEIDDDVKALIEDMTDVMYADDGVGLAANQVGVAKQLIVYDAGQGFHVLINPVITPIDDAKETHEEGCLSLPGVQVNVERFIKLKVEGLDSTGNKTEFIAEDITARVIQHEVDHLNGVLIIDHASSLQRSLMKAKLRRLEREGKKSD